MIPLFLLGLVISSAYWPMFIESATSTRWAAMAIGVPLCLLFARRETNFWPLLLLVIPGVTLFWTADLPTGLDEFSHFILMALTVCLAMTAASLGGLWMGLAVGVAGAGIIGLTQVLGWQGFPQAAVPGGTFVNKNFLAEAGLLSLVMMIFLRKWWLLLPLVLATLLPLNRGVLVATVVVILFLMLIRRRTEAIALAGTVALGGIVTILVSPEVSHVVSTESAAVRMAIWNEAVTHLTWFGEGLGSFTALYPDVQYVHNEFLHYGFELGLFSLLALPLAGVIFVEGYHLEKTLLLVIVVLSMVSFPLHLPFSAFVAALAFGRLLAARNSARLPADSLAARDQSYGGSRDDLGDGGPNGQRVTEHLSLQLPRSPAQGEAR